MATQKERISAAAARAVAQGMKNEADLRKTLQTFTVEELFDIDREECDEQVIKVDDLHKGQIIVEVSGGNVQKVYISPALKGIHVHVLDYDHIVDPDRKGKKTKEEQQAEQDIETGKVVSIY